MEQELKEGHMRTEAQRTLEDHQQKLVEMEKEEKEGQKEGQKEEDGKATGGGGRRKKPAHFFPENDEVRNQKYILLFFY